MVISGAEVLAGLAVGWLGSRNKGKGEHRNGSAATATRAQKDQVTKQDYWTPVTEEVKRGAQADILAQKAEFDRRVARAVKGVLFDLNSKTTRFASSANKEPRNGIYTVHFQLGNDDDDRSVQFQLRMQFLRVQNGSGEWGIIGVGHKSRSYHGIMTPAGKFFLIEDGKLAHFKHISLLEGHYNFLDGSLKEGAVWSSLHGDRNVRTTWSLAEQSVRPQCQTIAVVCRGSSLHPVSGSSSAVAAATVVPEDSSGQESSDSLYEPPSVPANSATRIVEAAGDRIAAIISLVPNDDVLEDDLPVAEARPVSSRMGEVVVVDNV